MITARLDEVELAEGWSEVDPDVGFEFGLAVSAANGSSSSQVICVNIESGKRGGIHTWEAPVMPIGGRTFVTSPPVEEDTQAAPSTPHKSSERVLSFREHPF